MSQSHADNFRSPVSPEVARLVARCIGQQASDEDWRQLNELLETDDDVLHYYVEHSGLNATLGSLVDWNDDPKAAVPPRRINWQLAVTLALACSLLFAVSVYLFSAFGGGENNRYLARRVFSTASDLQVAGSPQHETAIAPRQRITFSDGTVGFSLACGVDLVVDGPADLEIVSRNYVRLKSGRLIANAQQQAEPITIETPQCRVQDQGGRFGLASFVGQADSVAVFQGQLNLSRRSNTHALHRGDAVRIDDDGELSRLPTVLEGLFPNASDINHTTLADSVIESVTDNVDDDSVYGFYHVAPNGFGEDAVAYVDREHQWNSLGPHGIPPFLQNAEYVMTLNDDRFHEAALRINLKLRKPATVYVLYTECMFVPEWLSRDFVDTGYKIGMDEGPYLQNGKLVNNAYDLAVGANNSIDSNFRVWARKIDSPGVITLGGVDIRVHDLPQPEYGAHNGSNMYGIVVAPALPE
ncbi:hypothetical protein LOC68_02595 [Blastopirellula sp. JC732]|uniref:FecR protein domain-containing protein n=1 Tax=Blastopirellula sediminis TaxID=2894196 RepID=A0A9X1MJ50_9BACT|nr:hypothetical protein [Blastopirellula sediminis]MCC9607935.1 hypothetical protein [Blastopirellula sediminis]MCC9627272.1 hypothetical protein [Blastopirellula sediminis]